MYAEASRRLRSPGSCGRWWEGSGREVRRKSSSARTAAEEAWQLEGLPLNYVVVRMQLRSPRWCNLMLGGTTLPKEVSAVKNPTTIVIVYLLR